MDPMIILMLIIFSVLISGFLFLYFRLGITDHAQKKDKTL